jgi:hypothetical protein
MISSRIMVTIPGKWRLKKRDKSLDGSVFGIHGKRSIDFIGGGGIDQGKNL